MKGSEAASGDNRLRIFSVKKGQKSTVVKSMGLGAGRGPDSLDAEPSCADFSDMILGGWFTLFVPPQSEDNYDYFLVHRAE